MWTSSGIFLEEVSKISGRVKSKTVRNLRDIPIGMLQQSNSFLRDAVGNMFRSGFSCNFFYRPVQMIDVYGKIGCKIFGNSNPKIVLHRFNRELLSNNSKNKLVILEDLIEICLQSKSQPLSTSSSLEKDVSE